MPVKFAKNYIVVTVHRGVIESVKSYAEKDAAIDYAQTVAATMNLQEDDIQVVNCDGDILWQPENN